MNPIKGTLVVIALLTFALSASAQDMSSCDGTGKYCFADSVYDCVNGAPQQVEYCKGVCNAGKCINETLAPEISHVAVNPPEEAKGSDWVPLIILTIVAIAIFAFSLQIVKARKRARG